MRRSETTASQRKLFRNNENCIIIEDDDRFNEPSNFCLSILLIAPILKASESLNQRSHPHRTVLMNNSDFRRIPLSSSNSRVASVHQRSRESSCA